MMLHSLRTEPPNNHPQGRTPWLTILTAVYACVGLSPLFAFRFALAADETWAPGDILGLLSFIIWLLILFLGVKTVLMLLHIDNRGEGGALALLGVVLRRAGQRGRRVYIGLGLAGLGLLYGDTVLMPLVSVLAALEGLEIRHPGPALSVVPVAVILLAGLFLAPLRGLSFSARSFLPVMAVWFAVLAGVGLWSIAQYPQVLVAFDPLMAVAFVSQSPGRAWALLGVLVLLLAGSELVYAEMGHFSRRALQRVGFLIVLPALVLAYLGQGAAVLQNPAVMANPFFLMVPDSAVLPLTIVALLAALVASQAVIMAAVGATRQAVQLGYLPRMAVFQLADLGGGHTYLPRLNIILLMASLALLAGFDQLENLARAYGFAHAAAMLLTSLLALLAVPVIFPSRRAARAWSFTLLVLLLADALLVVAGSQKLVFGAWVPFVLGLLLCVLMFTWTLGRDLLRATAQREQFPLAEFMQSLEQFPPARVAGTAVFLNTHAGTVPPALLHNLKHNKVLHEQVVFLTVQVEDVPYVAQHDSFRLEKMGESSWELQARWGFRQETHVPHLLERVAMLHPELNLEPMQLSYFLSRQSLIVQKRQPAWRMWWRQLFAFLTRNAGQPVQDFRLPPNAVVEMGMQREI